MVRLSLSNALRRFTRESGGQATVELVGLLPVLVSIGFGAFWVLSSAASSEVAASAAQAGAMALIQDREPKAAARSALPKRFRKVAQVTVRGRKVTVTVPPVRSIPGLKQTLTVRSDASAGGASDGVIESWRR